jgi:hypothetical protein
LQTPARQHAGIVAPSPLTVYFFQHTLWSLHCDQGLFSKLLFSAIFTAFTPICVISTWLLHNTVIAMLKEHGETLNENPCDVGGKSG